MLPMQSLIQYALFLRFWFINTGLQITTLYDLSRDVSGSPVINGSIPLASDTEVDQMYYSAGPPQPGDQWQQYQDGPPDDSSINGRGIWLCKNPISAWKRRIDTLWNSGRRSSFTTLNKSMAHISSLTSTTNNSLGNTQ